MTYQEQIKHPKWQKKRLEVLEYNKYKCQECGNAEEELHVHHPFYRKGAMIWEYDKKELRCLCRICHDYNHLIDNAIKDALVNCKHKDIVLDYIISLNEKGFSAICAPTPNRKSRFLHP